MKRKRLFISNLGWKHKDFTSIKKLIKLNHFDGIDVAPLKLNKNWKHLNRVSKKISKELIDENIKVNAIQGIYYNKNFNLFKRNRRNITKIYNHTLKIIKICKIYKCNKIIIGSSDFRRRNNLNLKVANIKFINFFKKFKKILNKEKIYFCLETIPYQYNEDFIFNFHYLLNLIKKINSKWIKINFDTSLFHFNSFEKKMLFNNLKFIKNIQVTEKNFRFFVKPSKNNLKFCKSIKLNSSIKNISLEIISKKTQLKKLNTSMKNLRKLV